MQSPKPASKKSRGFSKDLCKASHVALLHGRVYFPQEWVNDRARYTAAKILEDERDFRTKDTLALQQGESAP
jgi:hypothetical protein